MRILSVMASPFGGIAEQTLKLGPQLTVVYGRNGTGKSTWHAALYAGLCGRVTGPGASDVDTMIGRCFAPTDRPDWTVTIDVELDNNERITVVRDLAGPGPDRATRASDHAVVSPEYLTDGIVDLATAIGLDRRSFAVCSWVGQTRRPPESPDAADLNVGLASAEFEHAVAEFIGTGQARQAAGRLEQAKKGSAPTLLRRAADEVDVATRHLGSVTGQRDRLQAAAAEVARHQRAVEAAEHDHQAAVAAKARRAVITIETALTSLRRQFAPVTTYLYDPPTPSDTEVHPTVAAAVREVELARAAEAEASEPALVATPDLTPDPTPHAGPGRAPVNPPVRRALRAGIRATGVAAVGLAAVTVLMLLRVNALLVMGAAVVTLLGSTTAGLFGGPGSEPAPTTVDSVNPSEPPRPERPAPAPAPAAALVAIDGMRLWRALAALAAALAARGVPTGPETAEAQLDAYRQGCASRAQLASVIATKEADLMHARADADEARRRVTDLDINQHWAADTDATDRARRGAWEALRDARQRLSGEDQHCDDAAVNRSADALGRARAVHERYQRLQDVLAYAEWSLLSAAEQATEEVRAGVRRGLRELLPTVTEERGLRVSVDSRLRVELGPGERRSYGIADQSSVLTRVALSRLLAPEAEAGPLLLDDITSRIDEVRAGHLLDLLRQLARSRQVVVFAHDATTRNWAIRAAADDPTVLALETTGVNDPVRRLSDVDI